MKILGGVGRALRSDKAPHTAALGRWDPHPDGSEIRYRAKWPGKE
jgi:hypothetical protein